MKSNKALPWLLIGVPVLIGGYFLFRFFKPSKTGKDFSLPPSKQPVVPVKAVSPSIFPIKSGSPYNDLVKQLQSLLGVTADGLFGPKTQAALLLKAGKTSITSQSDFDAVIAKLTASAQASAVVQRAEMLVSDWNKNSSSQLMAIADVAAPQIVQDSYGAMTFTGKYLDMKKNLKLNRQDYIPITATKNGFLQFKVTKGAFAGLYKIDPTKITLS